jgi:cysteine desulfurase / selenocysteine lyase
MMPSIYLDNGATSWPKPESVYLAADQALRMGGSAGRGSHNLAWEASKIFFEARKKLGELFHIDNVDHIVFVLNATDAINTALFGLLNSGDVVVTTAMEHNSVVRPLCVLKKKGVVLRVVRCTRTGIIDKMDLQEKIRGAKLLVLSHASNVTGQIVALEEIIPLAQLAHCLVLVDAAQTAGVYPIDVSKQGIDLLAFSGHKGLFGPQGTGGLYVDPKIELQPLCFGGTGSQSELEEQPEFYPDHLESGTQNMPGIAGLAAGVQVVLEQGVAAIYYKEQILSEKLRAGLSKISGVQLLGEGKVPHTSVVSFVIEGKDSSLVGYLLEKEYHIICRSGLHCSPWAHQVLGTLQSGAVRFSPGLFTTDSEIRAAIEAVDAISREDFYI